MLRSYLGISVAITTNIVTWALSSAVAFAVYYFLAAPYRSVDNTGLIVFQVFFYIIVVGAPCVSAIVAWNIGARLRISPRPRAAALAIAGVAIILLTLPLLGFLSVMNDCALGVSFPFKVRGCD